MSFYSLSELKFTSPYFSVIDCILNRDAREKAIYCSSELTTGYRLYAELRKHGVTEVWELKRDLGETWYRDNIENPNKLAANSFAASVRAKHKQTDQSLVITPAPFDVPDWGQPEYLAFWEELIRTRVKAIHFNENWEYSNGCTFEFAVALKADIPAFDSNYEVLTTREAIGRVERVVKEIEKGFDVKKLRVNLERMKDAAAAHSKVRLSLSSIDQ